MYRKMCLVIIDMQTKWIEATFVLSATLTATIEILRSSFAHFDLPSTVVTDNMPYFVGKEMESFLKDNGIKHPTSLPYHLQSNGLTERVVLHNLRKEH